MPLQALGQKVALANPAGLSAVLGPVAALSNGTLVLVGSYRNESGGHLSRLTADGEALSSLDVTVQGVGETYYADVKALTGGGFVVIYTNQGNYGPDEPNARAFAADGTPLGLTVHLGDGVTNTAANLQNEGFIIATRDGGWFVEYTDDSRDGTIYSPLVDYQGSTLSNGAPESYDVFGAFESLAGAPPGAARNLGAGQETAPGPHGGHYEGAAGEQRSGGPTALLNGAVVTPYIDNNFYTYAQNDGFFNTGRELGISFRIVAPSGATSEIRANHTYLDGGDHPRVDYGVRPVAATLSGGGFVLVWAGISPTVSGPDNRYYVVRTFDDAGNATTGELTLAVPSGVTPGGAAVVSLQNGGFALAYTVLVNGGDGHDVHLAAFDSQGQLLSDVVAAGGPGTQDLTGLTVAPDGSVDVTWFDGAGTGTQYYLQRFVLTDAAANQQVSTGDAGDNTLTGGAGNDWFDGEGGNDTLFGAGGLDHLYGGAGSDVLTGGAGADTLSGGSGLDVFRDTIAGLSGDTITDLGLGDVINVTDASYASFAYRRIGTVLGGGAQTVTLANNPVGHLIVGADTTGGGGVDLTLGAHVTGLNDFNADGHSDLLWRNTGSGGFTTWSISGNAVANQEARNAYQNGAVDNGWQVQGTLDFDGDGAADIVWRNTGSGAFTVWTSTGGGFTPNAYAGGVDTGWTMAGFGDFNGDGRDDVLWRNTASGQFTEWQGTGSGFNANVYVDGGVATDWKMVGVGDFNGDGRADILWRNTGGAFTVWSSSGNGFTPNTYVDGSVSTAWHVAAVADFNGDGRDDILWRNDNGAFTEWQSNGTGFDANVYVNGGVGTDWSLQGAFDFNDDGKADLVWRNGAGLLTVWQSTGNGFTPNTLVEGSVGNDWQLMTHHYDFV